VPFAFQSAETCSIGVIRVPSIRIDDAAFLEPPFQGLFSLFNLNPGLRYALGSHRAVPSALSLPAFLPS
jgi:hypothetical protein